MDRVKEVISQYSRGEALGHIAEALSERCQARLQGASRVHVLLLGLGTFNREVISHSPHFQLALVELILQGVHTPIGQKVAADPTFNAMDSEVLKGYGYTVSPATNTCLMTDYLKPQETDRVLAILPHMTLHQIYSLSGSLRLSDLLLSNDLTASVELASLRESQDPSRHVAQVLEHHWLHHPEHWSHRPIYRIPHIQEPRQMVGLNIALSGLSLYTKESLLPDSNQRPFGDRTSTAERSTN